ncbi:MAG: hypothetical protein NXI04_13550 [Planctomycetaceae bacterium]|nr:hypothetical protein [Planctomycetaceae bacterium]
MSAESFASCFATCGWSVLQTWLTDRELPFLFERSLRLAAGTVETRRGLLSVPASVLRQHNVPAAEVLQICRAMSSPESHRSSIARFLPSAGCIHFGFEATHTVRIGKCYLELPSSTASQLVFLGFKWSLDDDRLAVVSRYRALPISDQPGLKTQLLQQIPSTGRVAAAELIDTCVPASLTTQQLGELRLLEVSEEGSPRRSLDLNVYERQLTLRDIAEPATVFATGFEEALATEAAEMTNRRLTDWLTQHADSQLGHISLGTDRQEKPFLTLYHAADVSDTEQR